MALTVRSRPGTGDEPQLRKQTIGNALVVHRAGGMTKEALALALAVTEDTEHDLVVVDLPTGVPISAWKSVADLLPRRRKGLRLVVGGRSRETTALAGQWLSDRLGRTVIAPDGTVIPGAGGTLFVHSGPGSGWVRFDPGRASRGEGKRFPRPAWESAVSAEPTPTSAKGIAEPIPGGLWIRPVGFDKQQAPQRARLVGTVPLQRQMLTVILGSPGCPPLSLDDVARVFVRLPEGTRQNTRFVQFGPVSVPSGVATGQALADLMGRSVAFYPGMPSGDAAFPEVRTIRDDSSLGWRSFARELGYQPRVPGAPPPLPVLIGHQAPLPGLDEVAPGVYWYAPDAVVEVVQSGLLVRPPVDGARTRALRAATLDASVNNLTFDGARGASTERMRRLAQDLYGRLDQATRRSTRLLPAAALLGERAGGRGAGKALARIEPPPPQATVKLTKPGAPARKDGPVPADAGRGGAIEAVVSSPADLVVDQRTQVVMPPAALAPPSPPLSTDSPAPNAVPTPPPIAAPGPPQPPEVKASPAGTVETPEPSEAGSPAVPVSPVESRLQPTPEAAASALLPESGVEEERAWLRKNLGEEYGTMSNAVARVLSEHPGFQGELTQSSADVLTDAVAVQLYLSPQGVALDAALRTGTVGPHVPMARCVVSGLSRLPSHRGPSMFAASPSLSQWELYRRQQAVQEWGFVNAVTAPDGGLTGTTDVLVWSITARRTRLLEPESGGVEDRILFVPGTCFKVLELKEPEPDGRGLIMMRELAASEVDEFGQVDQDRGTLDELALRSLRQELEKWSESAPATGIGGSAATRFGALPGLVWRGGGEESG